jgi:hypothetical protein
MGLLLTLLMLLGTGLPARALAQSTSAQNQAMGLVLLLGGGARSAPRSEALQKKPSGTKKPAVPRDPRRTRTAHDDLNGRLAVRSAESSERAKAP